VELSRDGLAGVYEVGDGSLGYIKAVRGKHVSSQQDTCHGGVVRMADRLAEIHAIPSAFFAEDEGFDRVSLDPVERDALLYVHDRRLEGLFV
jgi:hypothetical protein